MLLRDDYELMLKELQNQLSEQSANWERSRYMLNAGIFALNTQLKAMPKKIKIKEKVVKDGFIR